MHLLRGHAPSATSCVHLFTFGINAGVIHKNPGTSFGAPRATLEPLTFANLEPAPGFTLLFFPDMPTVVAL